MGQVHNLGSVERREARRRARSATTSAPSPPGSTTTTPAAASHPASGQAAAPPRSGSKASSRTASSRTLIRGDHPHTGEEAAAAPPEGANDHGRADRPGNRRAAASRRRSSRPVAGFDLVFSAPKSVSLLHALGDEETRRAVNEAHAAAWQAALAYLEDEACVIRRGTDGVDREHGEGFVAAAYQHRTTRAQDPHLHTHVIVANMAPPPQRRQVAGARRRGDPEDATGSPPATSTRPTCAAELTRALGVEWEQPRQGNGRARACRAR